VTRRDLEASVLGFGFVAAGINHFRRPDLYEAIVPRWAPRPDLTHAVAGAAEVVLGAGLFPRRTRSSAARALVWLLLIVFPANVDMAVYRVGLGRGGDGRLERREGQGGPLLLWLRLPVQFLLIALLRRHLRPVRSPRARSSVG
jgi:uncharacterized membrane protein